MSDALKMPTSRGQALLATLGHTVMVTGNGRKKENTQNVNNTKQLRRVGEGVLPQESCTASGISRRGEMLLWGIRRFWFGEVMRCVRGRWRTL